MGGIWLKLNSDKAFRNFGLLFQANKDQNDNIKQLSIRAAVGNKVPIKFKITICKNFPASVLQDGEEIVRSLQPEHITKESDAQFIFHEHDIALPAQGTANIQINMESTVLYFKVEHYSIDGKLTQFFGNIAPESFDSINKRYEGNFLTEWTETDRAKQKWSEINELSKTMLSDCATQPFADNILNDLREGIEQLEHVRNEFVAGLIDSHMAIEEIREVVKYQLPEVLEDFGEQFTAAFSVEVGSTMENQGKYLANLNMSSHDDDISKKPIEERLKIYTQLLEFRKQYVMALQVYVKRVDNLQRDNPPQSRRCSELAANAREESETSRLREAGCRQLMSNVLIIADSSAVEYMADLAMIEQGKILGKPVMLDKELRPHEKEKDWHKLYSNLSKKAERFKHAEAAYRAAYVFYSQAANIITTIMYFQATKWRNVDDRRRQEHTNETALLFKWMDEIHNLCIDISEKYSTTLQNLEVEVHYTADPEERESINADIEEFSEICQLCYYLMSEIKRHREEINHSATVAVIQRQVAETVRQERRARKEAAIERLKNMDDLDLSAELTEQKRNATSKERDRVGAIQEMLNYIQTRREPRERQDVEDDERTARVELEKERDRVAEIQQALNFMQRRGEPGGRQQVEDDERTARVKLENIFKQIPAPAKPAAPISLTYKPPAKQAPAATPPAKQDPKHEPRHAKPRSRRR